MLLHPLLNWYTQRFPFPFRGWKYARRLLRLTGLERRLFLKKIHNGLLLQVSPKEHIQQQLFWYGFYEKRYVLAWERLVEDGSVVIDVGANIGYYSLVAAKKAINGRVYSFEPQSAPAERLLFNVQLNHLTNIHLVRSGLGATNDTVPLYLSGGGNDGMSSLRRGNEFGNETETIQLVRLDDWMATQNLSRLDGIKMDIEGAEMQALSGMQATLQKYHPFLFIEISAELLSRFGDTPARIYTYLQNLGYSPFRILENSRLESINTIIEDELVVFLPKESYHAH